jgi:hypothetical protein
MIVVKNALKTTMNTQKQYAPGFAVLKRNVWDSKVIVMSIVFILNVFVLLCPSRTYGDFLFMMSVGWKEDCRVIHWYCLIIRLDVISDIEIVLVSDFHIYTLNNNISQLSIVDEVDVSREIVCERSGGDTGTK